MSTLAMPVHVALVDQSGNIDAAELAQIAGAMNAQIQNDFAPIWHVAATVGAYPAAPAHTWAVIIQKSLDEPGALGYHTDKNNQPIAYVEYTSDVVVTISHETLEMLADPWGNRVTTALCPEGTNPADFGLTKRNHRVAYLVEVADPCERASYQTGGENVSDFLLPNWYRSGPGPGVKYSYTGYCSNPRQVADGGYVSFSNANGEWYQVFNQNGKLSIQDLGQFSRTDEFGSLREWADCKAREYRAQ